jgi:hypothetical protein
MSRARPPRAPAAVIALPVAATDKAASSAAK